MSPKNHCQLAFAPIGLLRPNTVLTIFMQRSTSDAGAKVLSHFPTHREALGSVWLSHDETHPQPFRSAETVEHKIPQKELSSRPLFQVSHEK